MLKGVASLLLVVVVAVCAVAVCSGRGWANGGVLVVIDVHQNHCAFLAGDGVTTRYGLGNNEIVHIAASNTGNPASTTVYTCTANVGSAKAALGDASLVMHSDETTGGTCFLGLEDGRYGVTGRWSQVLTKDGQLTITCIGQGGLATA